MARVFRIVNTSFPQGRRRRIWVDNDTPIDVGRGFCLRLFFSSKDAAQKLEACIHGNRVGFRKPLAQGESLDASAWIGCRVTPVCYETDGSAIKRVLLEFLATDNNVRFLDDNRRQEQ